MATWENVIVGVLPHGEFGRGVSETMEILKFTDFTKERLFVGT